MFTTRRLGRGEVPDSDDYNRLADLVDSLMRSVGSGESGVTFSNNSFRVMDGKQEHLLAKITSQGDGTTAPKYAYGWHLVTPNGNGTFTDEPSSIADSPAGTATQGPAFEVNQRTDVPADGTAIVELIPSNREGATWVFHYARGNFPAPGGGTVTDCEFLAGLTDQACLSLSVVSAAGACDCIDTTQVVPLIADLVTAGRWESPDTDDGTFNTCLGSGRARLDLTGPCCTPNLVLLGVVPSGSGSGYDPTDYTMRFLACGVDTDGKPFMDFAGGGTDVCNGTPTADPCDLNTFRLRVTCGGAACFVEDPCLDRVCGGSGVKFPRVLYVTFPDWIGAEENDGVAGSHTFQLVYDPTIGAAPTWIYDEPSPRHPTRPGFAGLPGRMLISFSCNNPITDFKLTAAFQGPECTGGVVDGVAGHTYAATANLTGGNTCSPVFVELQTQTDNTCFGDWTRFCDNPAAACASPATTLPTVSEVAP